MADYPCPVCGTSTYADQIEIPDPARPQFQSFIDGSRHCPYENRQDHIDYWSKLVDSPRFRGSVTSARPDWDTYFLGIARAVAARADCTRAQHGAVIVKDNRIISTGYNGSPAGEASCLAGACPRGQRTYEEAPGHQQGNHDFSNCIALHAEQNAIAYARERGDTIYITGAPCDMCSKLVKAAGITRVVHP